MKKLPFLFLVVFLSSQVYAWSDLGHSLVGAIADETINEKTKDFVRGILGIEPLSAAATWPDHVRDDVRFNNKGNFDFSNYHYCEIPNGYNYDSKPKKEDKDCQGLVAQAIVMLKDTSGKYSKEMNIIALRYLVHVMGDIHQPLHVGNGHDKGGNLCTVYWKNKDGQTINLHSFWDETIVQYLGETYSVLGDKKPVKYSGQYLDKIKLLHPEMFQAEAKKQAFTGSLKDWLAESQKIRESGVYPVVNNITDGPAKYPYCVWYEDQVSGKVADGSPAWIGAINKDSIPVLTEENYGKPMAAIAESQILKAGLRLAATLDDIAVAVAASTKPSPIINKSVEEVILQTLQDTFKNKPPQ